MSQQIGQINGKWSILFRVVLALNAIMLPPAISWAAWVSMQVINMKWEFRSATVDRFSGGMFIEVQDELSRKNPDVKWLSAGEIRRIQNNNPPYKH